MVSHEAAKRAVVGPGSYNVREGLASPPKTASAYVNLLFLLIINV